MEKTSLAQAQKFLESHEEGAPTAGESAIAWALIGIAENLGRVATALKMKAH